MSCATTRTEVQPKIDIGMTCALRVDAYKQLLATDVDIVIHATPLSANAL